MQGKHKQKNNIYKFDNTYAAKTPDNLRNAARRSAFTTRCDTQMNSITILQN